MTIVQTDIPDELFARIEDKWTAFVGSKEIVLPKRKLILWAIEQFALRDAEIRNKPIVEGNSSPD